MEGLRAHLLAAFVALHLLGVTLMALPAPGGGMSRSSWKDPTVQGEFAAWAERITAWGHPIEVAELEERLWGVAVAWMKARDGLLTPFDPYLTYSGSTQSWRMFVAPHRHPSRLEILVEEGGAWRLVYRARDPEADWLGTQLDHDRMRSVIFRFPWPPYRGTYQAFVRWLGPRAARDFPAATRLKVQFWRTRTPSPEEVLADRRPPGKVELVRVVDLEPLR